MRPATRAVRAGRTTDAVRDLSPALHQSSVFYAESVAEAVQLEDMSGGVSSYTRTSNPTTMRFEGAIAELESGEAAVATSSGMAALTLTFLTLLTPTDRVAISPHSYADTLSVLEELSARIGFTLAVFDLSAPDAHDRLAEVAATLIVVESPSNPMLRMVNLPEMAAVATRLGAKLIVDNTMATPINQRPLELGADLVIHSASKYLTGHHNVIGGVIVGHSELVDRLRYMRTITGICLDPHSSWLLLQGLQTLAIRVAAQNATATRVAAFLSAHPGVDFVAYPSLADDVAIANNLTGGGGVLTFGLRAGREAITSFLESLSLCLIAVSLGGTKTLIEAPSLMSHVQGGPDNKSLSVIPENAIRLSVGLEDAQDIIDDLAAGLDPNAGKEHP
ncbi:trans-sulfuration enzyme family protein [Stackebrandtia soli]|uniref:trans-sulfuration enzyme family protein n=1 Tax=Stackebrandtia soli TaxID=1892856 RepID=UPI0039EAB7DA